MSAVFPASAAATPSFRVSSALVLWALGAAFVFAVVLAGGIGAYRIAPSEVVAILLKALGVSDGAAVKAEQETVLMTIRLPRVLMAGLVGAGLAIAGAAFQGLFRNPLADAGLVGVSAGAAFGAAFVIVLGASVLPGASKVLGIFTLPLAAFIGALTVTTLVYLLSNRDGRISLPVMLLAGIAINALAGAGIGLFTYIATDEQLRNLTFWSLGSLAGTGWRTVAVCLPFVLLGLALALRHARALNALLLGEAEAGHLGVDVRAIKRELIIVAAMVVGVLVAFTGIIGFIGLVAPHIMRLTTGPDHRTLLPGAALLGATLAVLADTLARTVASPAEMPIGILTSLVGAPFFLALLLRERRAWGV
jgi:iron complex transport system permease protein